MNTRIARQEAISLRPMPPSRPEAVLKIEVLYDKRCHCTIRYVPDRFLLVNTEISTYLASLPWSELEDPFEVACVILDDLNNQLVPKWLQIIVYMGDSSALVEDRQPDWNNPALLSRQVVH